MDRKNETNLLARWFAPAAAGALLAGATLFGAGCNTTEGVGEDIEAAGDAIDDAAEDAKD